VNAPEVFRCAYISICVLFDVRTFASLFNFPVCMTPYCWQSNRPPLLFQHILLQTANPIVSINHTKLPAIHRYTCGRCTGCPLHRLVISQTELPPHRTAPLSGWPAVGSRIVSRARVRFRCAAKQALKCSLFVSDNVLCLIMLCV
jgi:hypothetical protein